ncbi:hypothetical protein AG1IA_01653 [Rhizoctonia solani AG-1 IA]|uniref:Uncharacterized protein n=1 Tax=Thanatephorus cucumeris (strain AG1-IA) TaxID=983506 RepID=L8X5F8_THACA|nr:hypothetical protein AG1IA_01653 [Rhizoctonia solani AG-1 IA]
MQGRHGGQGGMGRWARGWGGQTRRAGTGADRTGWAAAVHGTSGERLRWSDQPMTRQVVSPTIEASVSLKSTLACPSYLTRLKASKGEPKLLCEKYMDGSYAERRRGGRASMNAISKSPYPIVVECRRTSARRQIMPYTPGFWAGTPETLSPHGAHPDCRACTRSPPLSVPAPPTPCLGHLYPHPRDVLLIACFPKCDRAQPKRLPNYDRATALLSPSLLLFALHPLPFPFYSLFGPVTLTSTRSKPAHSQDTFKLTIPSQPMPIPAPRISTNPKKETHQNVEKPRPRCTPSPLPSLSPQEADSYMKLNTLRNIVFPPPAVRFSRMQERTDFIFVPVSYRTPLLV